MSRTLFNFSRAFLGITNFDEMLEQMLNYSYENKKKFDIIASIQMCEVGDEELSGIPPKVQQAVQKQ